MGDAVFKDCSDDEKSELLKTLDIFFKHNGDITAAANEAFVHPNTFLYRLNKVTNKTKLNPRKPQDSGVLLLLSLFNQLNCADLFR